LRPVTEPLALAVEVSLAKVIRSIVDTAPPPIHPYVNVLTPAPACLGIDNGPRILAVLVSVANVMR
jgi:hypothetical protein